MKRGRPALPADKVKSERAPLRLTTSEYDRLYARARAERTTVAQFLRALVFRDTEKGVS